MEEEFYNLLNKTKDINKGAFENNWPYIVQSTRNGLLREISEDSIIYITSKEEKDSTLMVIVNVLGSKRKEHVLDIAKKNAKKGIKTLLKNVEKSEKAWWIENNFIETIQPWSKYSFRDDNSFPQYNISQKSVIDFRFSRDLRRSINRLSKKRQITTELYDSKYDGDALNLLEKFSIYSEKKNNDFAIEVKRGHQFFFDSTISNKIRLQHIESGELIGFSFITIVGTVAFYNALICKNESNLMKYLIYEGMRFALAHTPSITLFGLQGSETKGQDSFKAKFHPTEAIEKTHMIYKVE